MKNRIILISIPILSLLSMLFVFGSFFWFHAYNTFPASQNISNLGAFGDYIGGILNPFLTFITIIALVASLHYQVVELNKAEENIRQSADSLKNQELLHRKHSFELSFYQIISMHHSLVDSYSQGGYTGSEYFKKKLAEASRIWKKEGKESPLSELDSRMYRHPFVIVNILNMIKRESSITEIEKQMYFDLLKSNLSDEFIKYCKECSDHEFYRNISTEMQQIGNDA